MSPKGYLYRIRCFATKQIYVGSCRNVERRWLDHLRTAKNLQAYHPLYYSLRCYSPRRHTVEIIRCYNHISGRALAKAEQREIQKVGCYPLSLNLSTRCGRRD